ncbi:serine hydroxymethyltransferase [Candidatus Falkowbacteria bacterium]|nr:serine hydroxymethyltransferase [Candidatus Falkowbacteria bacterium]
MLKKQDPIIYDAIQKELERQQNTIELIPSENYVSPAVLEALGSILTNKYAEGYPSNRYYGGTANVDIVEQTAIDRAKKLFNAEHANVQPLSGAQANIAAYFALLKQGETILGMDLSHGGHLTHGHPVTKIAKIFNFIRYKTLPTGEIDYAQLRKMALEHKPRLILVGFSAYSRSINYKKIKEIADKVNAYTMADIAHIAGLIAAGVLENPVPLFDAVTSTTHKTLRGPRGGVILCKKQFAAQIDKSVFPGLQGGPHEHNIAAKAVAFREALQPEFKQYAEQILKNAKALENVLKQNGFTIAFGTTENHLLLIDLRNPPAGPLRRSFSEASEAGKNISGLEAQTALEDVNIVCNKNMIPDDPRQPLDPSGIRLGTPAMTTRGFKEQEFILVGKMISDCLTSPKDPQVKQQILEQVKNLTKKFPLPY